MFTYLASNSEAWLAYSSFFRWVKNRGNLDGGLHISLTPTLSREEREREQVVGRLG